MSKGSQSQKSSQTVQPPDWAKPLLQKAAGAAMSLYDQGSGFNPYRGPTVADFSPEKIAALNNMLKMTGSGQQVSNAAMTGDQNTQVQQARALIQQQMAQQQAARAAAAAAAASPAGRYAPRPQQPQMFIRDPAATGGPNRR